MIYIIDGFDMVGKTSYIKSNLKGAKYWHPTHDLTDSTIGRVSSWSLGYGVLDFLSQTSLDQDIVIDRGVASSYVYNLLYIHKKLPKEVIQYYRDWKWFHKEVKYIHIRHSSENSARKIFSRGQTRGTAQNELSAKYDRFRNFDQYWDRYLEAEKLFTEAYFLLEIIPEYYYTVAER